MSAALAVHDKNNSARSAKTLISQFKYKVILIPISKKINAAHRSLVTHGSAILMVANKIEQTKQWCP